MHTREHRQRVVAASSGSNLGDSIHESRGRQRAGDLRERGQLRVIIQRHERQLKTSRPALQQQTLPINHGNLNRFCRHVGHNVRHELARHSNATRLIHLGADAHSRGHFVVKAREFQTVVIRSDDNRAQHRLRVLRRQVAGDPRDSVSQVILMHAE